MPLASTDPHNNGHDGPDTLHSTDLSGCAPLLTTARNACEAPSSTGTAPVPPPDGKLIETSLCTVTIAVPDLLASAWLVAVTVRFAGIGKSSGAVYTPPLVIVPVCTPPPATPFTLQVTALSELFFTAAAKRN